MSLSLCASCKRFHKGSSCTFCGSSEVQTVPAPSPRDRAGRWVRASMLLGLVSCGTSIQPAYGLPCGDGGPNDPCRAPDQDAAKDSATSDAGSDARDATSDAGSDARDATSDGPTE